MNVLIAIEGPEGPELVRRAAELIRLRRAATVLIAHVIDAGPRAEMDLGRERFLGRRGLGEERATELQMAEQESARAALRLAREELVRAGVDAARILEIVLRGKPNEELRRLAEQHAGAVIVVAGRAGRPGPHSLGKTARFLVDHAPYAAVVIRP